MRNIHIDFTGANAPVDFFAGYTGEANNTRLTMRLPENLLSEDIDYYRIHFKTGAQENIRSEKLYAQEGVITLTLWYELLRNPGTLFIQASAYDFEDNELVRLGKTPIATLKIQPSLAAGTEANRELFGLEAELEELMRLHNENAYLLTVNTVSDLPADAQQGALALVRNPPPRFVTQSAVPILPNRSYPRMYLNPHPPRPEHLYSGAELPFFDAVFRRAANGSENPTPTFYLSLYDGSDGGIPNMLHFSRHEDTNAAYFYVWEAFQYEGQQSNPGWNILYADNENEDSVIIEPIAFSDIPTIEYAGEINEPSPYLGYYLSASPYMREKINALFVFDGSAWKEVSAENTTIKPVGIIPVRGVEFPAHQTLYYVGYTAVTPPARVVPSFASDKGIAYAVSDETVITAALGYDEYNYAVLNVTGLRAGTATITATSHEGGYTATREITVQEV